MPEGDPRVLPVIDHVPRQHDTSYPADLSRLLGVPVLNYGLNGERTDTGLKRFRKMLAAVRPSTVIVLEGVNDLLQGRKPHDVVTRLRRMVYAASAARVRPVLVTLLPTGDPHVNAEIASVNAGLRQLARATNTALVDAHGAFASVHPVEVLYRQPNGQTDGLHPNDAGYTLLAGTVARAMQAARPGP